MLTFFCLLSLSCAIDKVECIQTIQVGKKYAQSIAISFLPNTSVPVMAVGSTDNRISIYVMQSKQVRSSPLQPC